MDVDAELFEQVGQGTCPATVRCYTWIYPAVTIGRHQDEEAVRAQFPGRSLYRRPTGGRAVEHGDDLTISLAARHSELLPLLGLENGKKGVLSSYFLAVAPVRSALATFGVDTTSGNTIEAHTRRNTSEDCFASAARCDVLDEKHGIKILGSAMRRSAEAVLVQMSLRPIPDCNIFSRAFIDELREQYTRDFKIGRWNIATS